MGAGASEDAAAAAPRESVISASLALAAAIVSNDADRIGELLGEEWRLVDADGETGRDRFLDVVRGGQLTHSMMRPVTDLDVRVYGETAVVFARVVNTAQFDGRTFHADEWTTDVFVRRGGRWECVHSHVTAARDRSVPS